MGKQKKKTPYNAIGAIRGSLRRAFSRSPMVREVLLKTRREIPKYRKDGSRAKKDAVQYQCNICKQYAGSTKISVDHIIPVIPETGFTNWNDFIDRLFFCGVENLQSLCDTCHDNKTKMERQTRQKLQYSQQLMGLSKLPSTPENLKLIAKLKKKLSKLQ